MCKLLFTNFLLFSALLSPISLLGFSSNMDELKKKVNDLEVKMDQIAAENAEGSYGINATRASPDVFGRGIYLTADLLFWHPKVDKTSFAYTNNNPGVTAPIKGSNKSISFGWDMGFRFGAGYNISHDDWDIYLTYTQFEAANTNATHAAGLSTVIPLKGSFITSDGVEKAKADFAFDYYSFDLSLGKYYFISSSLALRPFFGLKNAWVDLAQRTTYSGGEALGNNMEKIKDSSNFWGAGALMGFNSLWFLSKHIHLFSNFSNTFLYGLFDVEHREKLTPNPMNKIKIKDGFHRFVPMVEFSSGVAFRTYLNRKKNHIEVKLGYQGQFMWDINQMMEVYEYNAMRYSSQNGDASLHGVTLSAILDF